MAPFKPPTMSAAELTRNSSVKLSPYGRGHFVFPTSQWQGDPSGGETWSTYQGLLNWSRNSGPGVDLFNDLVESPNIEVGVLQGTRRAVYATFDVGSYEGELKKSKILKTATGALKITLFAGPIESRQTTWRIVPNLQLVDIHGLAGFYANVEVLDWNIVDFAPEFASSTLEGSYAKVVKELYEGDTSQWQDVN